MSSSVAFQKNMNVQQGIAPVAPLQPVQNVPVAALQFPEQRIKKVSVFWKAFACLPYFGGFSEMLIEGQLKIKLNSIEIDDLRSRVKVLKITNNFLKIANIRKVIEMALLVIIVAFGTTIFTLIIGGLLFFTSATTFELTRYQIRTNSVKIERMNSLL